jgi:fatty-acyl-CoA synthase
MAAPVFPQAVLDLLDAGGDRPVFEHGDRVVGAREMARLIRRIAAGLRAAGIGPADGVAMMLGVTPEAFAAIIAGYAVGARVAGVRPGLTDSQLAHLLGQDMKAAVVDRPPDFRYPPALPLADLLETPDDGRPLVAAGRPGDIARITYTSGSTGNPKGCAQTYAGLTAAWAAHPNRWPPAVRELAAGLRRYLVFGSLASQVMIEYSILTLAAGGTMVVADPPSFPDAFPRYRATASVITVPRLYRLVRDQQADPVNLRSLRVLLVSGSPLDPGRLREAIDVLGPVVYHGYGQTETGLITMLTPAEAAARAASVGRAPSVIDLQVRDAAGHPVPVGTEGELFVRTPAQATGYWADPAETSAVFVDGWVRTRDLARLDDEGYLRLLGRVRDVIIVNANIVYAGPIERVLADHPDVAEAYVVAAADDDTGEAPHAFVVPTAERTPDHAALRALVGRTLGAAAVPRTITMIDAVPVAPSGKPDKHALVRLAEPLENG